MSAVRPHRLALIAVLAFVLVIGSALPSTAARSTPSTGAAAAKTFPRGYGPSVTLSGHGYGHGIGMSQVGAYGYAVHFGWTAQQILAHYYGGTTLGSADPAQPLTVRLTAGDDNPVGHPQPRHPDHSASYGPAVPPTSPPRAVDSLAARKAALSSARCFRSSMCAETTRSHCRRTQ